MRQHRSLFLLFLRHSFWRVLLALCGAAEWLVFFFRASKAASLYDALSGCSALCLTLFLLCFAAVSALLLWATVGWGKNQPRYTMTRLSLSTGWVLVWQGVYNTLIYLLFWWVQALILVGLRWFYGWQGGLSGAQHPLSHLVAAPLFPRPAPPGDFRRVGLQPVPVCGAGVYRGLLHRRAPPGPAEHGLFPPAPGGGAPL